MKDTIEFGSKRIEYDWQYTSRKTLGITVTPDMEVFINAPEATPLNKIREKVRKNAPWILKQQYFFSSFHPKMPERKYVSGETHLYMGRQMLLKITLSEEETVKYKGGHIEVLTQDKSNAPALVKSWYKERAKIKLPEIAAPLIQKFKKHSVVPSQIRLQEMPTRWGSCTPTGKIILNPELIKAPKPCIEYVIVHELCHLIHHNHTQKFIDLQTKEMPDWERWKRKLEELLA